MDDEVLIRSVRKHSFLYDPCDKRHKDLRLVKNTWEEVARTVHSSASECKKRWTSLRDQFRRNVVKRLRNTAGAEGAAGTRVKWRYEDHMSFLLPHMKERVQKPCSKNPGRDAAASDDDDDASSQSLEYSTTQSHASHRLESPSSTPSVSPVPSLLASEDEHHRQPPRKRTRASSQQQQRDVLQSFFSPKRAARAEAPMDHIGAFFLSVETSVRRLPPLLQIEAKARVGALVSDLEMRAYVADQQSASNLVANASSRALLDGFPSPRASESAPVVHCSTTSSSILPDEASANDVDERKPFDD